MKNKNTIDYNNAIEALIVVLNDSTTKGEFKYIVSRIVDFTECRFYFKDKDSNIINNLVIKYSITEDSSEYMNSLYRNFYMNIIRHMCKKKYWINYGK